MNKCCKEMNFQSVQEWEEYRKRNPIFFPQARFLIFGAKWYDNLPTNGWNSFQGAEVSQANADIVAKLLMDQKVVDWAHVVDLHLFMVISEPE